MQVNRRAQRLRLNLVLGQCGVCGTYEYAASPWSAMERPDAEFPNGRVCGTGDAIRGAWIWGGAERRQNPKPCATSKRHVLARDDGLRSTFVFSVAVAASAEHG